MKIPTKENIDTARRIHQMLPWDQVDELLFGEFKRLPRNTDLKHVAHKVTLVDRLYGCNLMVDVSEVANHIVHKKIDPGLTAGDVRVVYKISKFPAKYILAFASKYCYFHRPDKFPIWDQFAAIGLGGLTSKDYYKSRNYNEFKTDIDRLNSAPSLRLSYRALDEYLWLYGRKLEPKKMSREVERLAKSFPRLFAQLDPPNKTGDSSP